MLALIELLVNAALLLLAAGLLLGILGGVVITVCHWAGAACGLGFVFVTDVGGRVAGLAADLVAGQLNGRFCRRPAQPSTEELQARIASLEQELAAAVGKAAGLARRAEELRAELKRAAISEDARLYAEVGLHPNSEDFLVRAARQAYRKHYHPDVCRSLPPEIATRMFQGAERCFERIWRTRGLC